MTLFAIVCCSLRLQAQDKQSINGYLVPMCIYNGDTIPCVQLRTVYIFRPLKFKNEKERQDFEKLSARSYKIGMGKYTQECLKSIDEDLEEIAKKSFNFAGGHPWEESLAADKNKLCTEEDLPTLKFKPAPPATNDYERRIDKLIEYDKKTPDIFWEREMRKEIGLPYKGY